MSLNKYLNLDVKDDRVRFDMENLPQDNLGGNGLKGMKSRAEEVMENLQVISGKGQGL